MELGPNLRCLPALAMILLGGCTAARLPAPTAQISSGPTNAADISGTVVAIRTVDIASQGGGREGVNAVLTALQQAPAVAEISSQEIVIRKTDDAAISLTDAQPGFAVGDHVAIITGASTAIINHD